MSENSSTVLVIDDNHDLAELIACFLAHGKIRPVIAVNGIAGLRQARTHLPAVILCDSCMPGMDGLEVIEALQSNPATAHVPIVLMSGNDVAGYDGSGASALLQKPFTMAEMLALVRSLITRQQPAMAHEHDREVLECAA